MSKKDIPKNKPSLRQRMAVKSLQIVQKVAVKRSYKDMIKMSEEYRPFIDEIQDKCGDVVELVPENKQGAIIATLCSNLIQGFDTKQEMDYVIDMIKTAIDEYWKIDDIPQKRKF